MSAWPARMLLTNSEGLYLVEHGRRAVVLEQERRAYYGISWHGDRLYVGCECGQGDTSTILVLDPRLQVVTYFSVPAKHAHQILWHRGSLLVTSTETNEILAVDLETGDSRPVFHTKGKVVEGIGEDHVNSLWADPAGRLHVVEHRQSAKFDRPSRFRVLDEHFSIEFEVGLGLAAHNVYVEDGIWYACDSLAGDLMRIDFAQQRLRRKALGAFTRGLARPASGGFVVGLSDPGPREGRALGQTRLARLDADLNVVDEVQLPIFGGVHEVRVLGEVDLAHSLEAFD